MLAGLFKRSKGEFITVERIAKQRGCDVRTVYALISRGILPPLVGYQKGLAAKDKGWDPVYWDEWYKLQAQSAVEESGNFRPRRDFRSELEIKGLI